MNYVEKMSFKNKFHITCQIQQDTIFHYPIITINANTSRCYSSEHVLSGPVMSHVSKFAKIFRLHSDRHHLINHKTFIHHSITSEDKNIYTLLVYI